MMIIGPTLDGRTLFRGICEQRHVQSMFTDPLRPKPMLPRVVASDACPPGTACLIATDRDGKVSGVVLENIGVSDE